MVWLVNMADGDRPKRNSTGAASPQQEAPPGRHWGGEHVEVPLFRLSWMFGLTVVSRL